MQRIITVTPNPSLDLLFEAEQLTWDDANRLAPPRRRPGGQGINVARALHEFGVPATAVALLGGQTGDIIERMLEDEGIPIARCHSEAETRTFVAVRENASGRSLLLNARGEAARDEEARLHGVVGEELGRGDVSWLICSGSVPAGFAPDFYARLAESARVRGVRVCVDSDGAPLERSHHLADLLVPNEHEAARLLGRSSIPIEHATEAVRALLARGAAIAAIKFGERGAVLATAADRKVWFAAAPSGRPGSSAVGAGDAFLAGLLVALENGDSPARVLERAVAAGTAVLDAGGAELVRRQQWLERSGEVEAEMWE